MEERMSDRSVLLHELTRLETELWNAVDARLRAELDAPLSRYETLRIVDATADCRVLDIAQTLAITMGGASKLADRVEADGLIQRRSNPADGRSTFLTLTDAGRDLLARAVVIVDAELERRIDPVLRGHTLGAFIESLQGLRATGHAIDSTERKAQR
jgi:DNA-binding MarR family transcriptional regulator